MQQLEQLNQTLNQDIVQAEARAETARDNAERITARFLAEPAHAAPAPGAAAPRPATVPLPDAFEGDPKKYLDFKTKLNNKYRADAPTFRDEHRLSIAVSLLKEGAADIMRPYLRADRIDLENIDELWTVLDRAFDDPDRAGMAERAIQALKQGKREFAHYFADFMRLKTNITWNDSACIVQLRKGCSQEIRNLLLNRMEPLPNTLQATAEVFNRMDIHIRQWMAENAKTPTPTTPLNQKKPLAPVVPASQRTTSNPAWTGPAPMDLSASNRAAVRKATREARRAKAIAEGLCFTCSSPDHGRANCPIQAQYDQARALRAAATMTPGDTADSATEQAITTRQAEN